MFATTLRVAWSLLRPQTYLLMCVYVGLGIIYGLAVEDVQLSRFLLEEGIATVGVFAALALWYIAGTALNDYADYEIDKINLKHDAQRPLVQGLVSRRQLLQYGQFASVATLTIVLLTNKLPVVILFVSLLLLNVAYSLKPIQISHRGGIAPLLLPLGYIVLTVNSGLLLTGLDYSLETYLLVAAMYLHFMSRIVLKDHRDVRGDAEVGKKTLVLKYGNQVVATLALCLFVASTMILVWLIWANTPRAVPYILLLASGAAMALIRLSHEDRWPYQKPFITVFGRFCSGVITIFMVGLLPGVVQISARQLDITFAIVSTLFFISIFDIIRLQHPVRKS